MSKIHLGRVIPLLLFPVFIAACAQTTALGTSLLESYGFGGTKTILDAAVGVSSALRDLNREEEYYLGRAVAARLFSKYDEVSDADLLAYVERVGQIVARHSERPHTFGGYHFSVLDSDDINAYAAPGGFVFVTTGLLRVMPDEDALASVLSHEVAHIALRHGEKAISEKGMTDSVLALGALAGSVHCSEVLQQASMLFGGAVEDVLGQVLEKGYSRELEREADIAGLRALVASGYRRESAIEAMQILQKVAAGSGGGWNATHPRADDRIERLRELDLRGPDSQKGYAQRQQRFQRVVRQQGY